MNIPKLTEAMIDYSEGNLHDIAHFLKVWSYARTIAQLEQVDEDVQNTLEAAALVHDIACPLCREKYGNTNGKAQEREGGALARPLLERLGGTPEEIDRIVYLIEHHHTYTDVDGMDYQILLEADFLVNADESGLSEKAIRTFEKNVFRTVSGKRLLESVYLKKTV